MRSLPLFAGLLFLVVALPVPALAGAPTACVLFQAGGTMPLVITEPVTCTFTCDHEGEIEVVVEYAATDGFMQVSCGSGSFAAAFDATCFVQPLTPLGPCSASFTTQGDSDIGVCRFIPGAGPAPTYAYHARCYAEW